MTKDITGLNSLSMAQQDHMHKVNKHHTECVGLDYKEGMRITEAWVDDNNCVCVRLSNGEWYHYYSDGVWG